MECKSYKISFKKILANKKPLNNFRKNENLNQISSLVNSSIQQLIQSFPLKSGIILSEIIPNLLRFNSPKYLITSKAVKFLKLKDCKEFSKVIVDRLSKNETFNRELEILEHFIKFSNVLSPFEPSFKIILK